MMTAHGDTVISLLLKPIKQCFNNVTSFRLSKMLYSPSALFKRSNNFGTISPNRLVSRIYETKFPSHVSFIFLFPHFIFL